MRRIAPFFMSLLVAAGPLAAAKPWAQVTYLRGAVTVTPSGSSEVVAARLGMVVHEGDTVTVPDGGKATCLLQNGAIRVYTAGTHALKAEGRTGDPSMVKLARNFGRSLLKREGNNPMLKHIGGVRSGADNLAVAPNRTRILPGDIRFAWRALPGIRSWAFTLMAESGVIVEKRTTDTHITIDREALGDTGQTWFWEVRDGRDADSFVALGSGSFTVLSQDEAKRIETLIAAIDAARDSVHAEEDFTPLFLKYQVFRQHGLNLDAMITLRTMMARDPGNELMAGWQSSLMREMALAPDALTLLASE